MTFSDLPQGAKVISFSDIPQGGKVIDKKMTISEGAIGVGEVLAQVASGSFGQVAGGLSGIGAGLSEGGLEGHEAVSKYSNMFTYAPRTDAGQRFSKAVATPFEWLDEKVSDLSYRLAGGDPLAATTIKTAIMGLPALVGFGKGQVSRSQAKTAINELETQAQNLGIEIGSPEIRRQIADAAEDMAPDYRGEAIGGLQDAVKNAKSEEGKLVDAKFDLARESNASLDVQTFRGLSKSIQDELSTYDVDMMPVVQKRMGELAGYVDKGGLISLEEISKWRTRLNRNRPAAADTSQNAALNIMKGQLDDFLDRKFDDDMIVGDPRALNDWKAARSALKDYKDRFSRNKVIRDLVEKEATPETVRQWVMGASSVGAKKEAGLVVQQLKDILGEDSPQIRALRQEFVFDVVEPLLRPEPDLIQFVRNYDRIKKQNHSALTQLSTRGGLDALRNFAASAQQLKIGDKFDVDLERSLSTLLLGNQLAKASMRLRLGRQVLKALRAAPEDRRKAMLSDMTGLDMNTPILTKGSLAYSAILAEEVSEKFNGIQ